MRGRAGALIAGVFLIGVLVLAVYPLRAWLDQRSDHTALVAQEAALTAENRALQERTDQLHSDAEIERIARRYNLVKPGEEQYFIRPRAQPPQVEAPPPPPAPKGSASLWHRITSIF